MDRVELVAAIAKATGVEKVAVRAVMEQLMTTIKSENSKGKTVYLRGFGSFGVTSRAAKKGRNITLNTSIDIPAHVVPVFKVSKSFKKMVRELPISSN